MKSPPLWKISVETSPQAEEAVVELLQRLFGKPASVFTNAETDVTVASTYVRPSEWSAERSARLRDGLRKIRAWGLEVDPETLSRQKISREDWAESWKRHFKPMEIGPALLVKPSWSQRRAKAGQGVVTLDPGLSFGTGQHPTTRFCLEQLVACRRRDEEQSFLDIGTGSGILAIAAAKLGYRPVEGFDSDRTAIRIARANARRNRVSQTVRLVWRDLTRMPVAANQTYDVICANLTSDLLQAEKRRIMGRLKRTGRLVLAGILRAEFEAVRGIYEESGLQLVAESGSQEWQSAAFCAPLQ